MYTCVYIYLHIYLHSYIYAHKHTHVRVNMNKFYSYMRQVNAATMPPYDADTSRPYSAPIQFATRRIAALAQDNPHV